MAPKYTPFPREAIVIEPKRGGRWFERGTEGNGGTRVDLEHRDLERLGDLAEATYVMLGSDEGWAALLARFAAVVEPAK